MNQDLQSDATFSFPTDGREKWADEMEEYGYVEYEGYLVTDRNYCCGNCKFMQKINPSPKEILSPTGYWCTKFNFPDRPEGCCDGWVAK